MSWSELKYLFLSAHPGGSLAVEIVAAGIIVALGLLAPRLGSKYWRKAEAIFRQVAAQRLVVVLIIGLLAFWTSAIRSMLVQVPQPAVHDEFSYLLAADTIAHGRLSNPSHPFWVHFESFHILLRPTYASKYPPGQGIFLAVGQVIFGYPIVGVWISIALACAALCWMLQGWVSPSWALVGSFLAMVRLVMLGQDPSSTISGYWSQSYWGGAVATIGGALLFGSIRRIIDRPTSFHAVTMGLGIFVLTISRPFEGLLVSLPAIGLLLRHVLKEGRPTAGILAKRILIPLSGMIALSAILVGIYNHKVTGSWSVLPYQVYEEQYSAAPVFLWQRLKPEPQLHNEVFHDFNVSWAIPVFEEQQSVQGFILGRAKAALMLWTFFFQVVLLLPLMAMGRAWCEPWTRFALTTCSILLLGLMLETWSYPHYAAPAACLLYVLMLAGMRRLRVWRYSHRPFGLSAVRGIVFAYLIFWVAPVWRSLSVQPDNWNMQRVRIQARLAKQPGRHLVIVRYSPQHSPHREWVYNEADIDGAKVVWARDLGITQNQKLLEYFADRRVWLLDADTIEPRAVPYPQNLSVSYSPPFRILDQGPGLVQSNVTADARTLTLAEEQSPAHPLHHPAELVSDRLGAARGLRPR